MPNSVYQQSYIGYVAETTPGETPATPSMLKLRSTNPLGITPNKALLESEEVLAHRQREHVRHGLRGVSGSIPFELSYGAYNDWLEALLSGEFSTGILKAGTTVKTFTIEQRIAADKYIIGRGIAPTQLSLTMNPTGLISGSWELIGMDFESAGVTLGAPSDVATNAPFDGLGNAVITEGGAALATVTSVEMTINANKTVGALIGKAGGDAPVDGQLQVNGTLTARFDTLALFDKFEAETDSTLNIEFTDPDGTDTLAFTIPKLKYNSGEPQNNDNVIDVSCSFEGLYDATEASSIVITDTPGL